ncbi:hypothetical protein QFZ79_000259 [Arthrobacter sp. V4I6]|nr:hypothetical protein [Arthrobacter sp. V1I7]MDQ0852148.1 hypothetical protein [Arthrobacter sp. V4I6]
MVDLNDLATILRHDLDRDGARGRPNLAHEL